MRFGARRARCCRASCSIAVALGWFARVPVEGRYFLDVLPTMILLGAGAGVSFPALMNLAMSGATQSDAGLASGLVNTTAQVGGALGLAVLATLAAARTASLRGPATRPSRADRGLQVRLPGRRRAGARRHRRRDHGPAARTGAGPRARGRRARPQGRARDRGLLAHRAGAFRHRRRRRPRSGRRGHACAAAPAGALRATSPPPSRRTGRAMSAAGRTSAPLPRGSRRGRPCAARRSARSRRSRRAVRRPPRPGSLRAWRRPRPGRRRGPRRARRPAPRRRR